MPQAAVDQWLARLAPVSAAAAARFAAFAGSEDPAVVEGLFETPERADATAAVREVFETVTDAPGVNEVHLLRAASLCRGDGTGVAALLRRVAEGEAGSRLPTLAANVAAGAALTAHPAMVFRSIAEWLVDPSRPLMSDDAFGGMARLCAAECRLVSEEQDARARYREERLTKRLRETATWGEMVRQTARCDVVTETLSAEEVEDLLTVCAEGRDPAEISAALAVLGRLVDGEDPRLTPDQRGRLALLLRARVHGSPTATEPWQLHRRLWARLDTSRVAEELLGTCRETGTTDRRLWDLLVSVRQHAPSVVARVARSMSESELAAGRSAFLTIPCWIELARGEAEEFLASRVDLAGLSDAGRQSVAAGLLQVGTDAAIARLRGIAALGDEAGEAALIALEILGAVPQERIEALADRWRRTRTRKSLSRLYSTYIERLPAGTPFERWLERLGHTDRKERGIWIRPVDGGSLYLELDEEHRLRALSYR